MLLPRFEYHEPTSVEEACQILGELGARAKVLAGGTDLLVNMKKGLVKPPNLVGLDRIRDLDLMASRKRSLALGGMTRVVRVAKWEKLPAWAQALGEGAASLGTTLIRNRATVAGNLVTARPAADLPPPLIALGARIELRGRKGARELPVEFFFRGPGETEIRPDEILTTIRIDSPPPCSGSAYLKLGVRQTLEIAMVNVAAALTLEHRDGPIKSARVVLGAVGPIPLRSPSAEACLVGERPSEPLFAAAGKAAAQDARPIDDYRGSAEYRRWMVDVLTRRTLTLAWKRAIGA